MKNELRSGLGMYTPNLESARESKYLALQKKKKRENQNSIHKRGSKLIQMALWPNTDWFYIGEIRVWISCSSGKSTIVSLPEQDQRRREEMPFIHISGTLSPGGLNSCVLFPVLVCTFWKFKILASNGLIYREKRAKRWLCRVVYVREIGITLGAVWIKQ